LFVFFLCVSFLKVLYQFQSCMLFGSSGMSCSLVEVYWCFRGACCFHYQGGKLLPHYMAQHPRKQSSSYSPLWEPEISPCLTCCDIH
jgi:hypothetical protein